jgi:hypothetical protein
MAGAADLPWADGFDPAASSGRDRREAERAIAFWAGRLEEYGGALTIAGLDIGRVNRRDWWNRFLIAVDPVVERSSLVLYGPSFARLLHLPEPARPDVPLLRQLPRRYGDIFLRGCTAAQKEMAPVRLEGDIERLDGRIDQYRAVFIPVGVKPNSLTFFAFGAFNSRIVEPTAT